jgi:hypothetical protein
MQTIASIDALACESKFKALGKTRGLSICRSKDKLEVLNKSFSRVSG